MYEIVGSSKIRASYNLDGCNTKWFTEDDFREILAAQSGILWRNIAPRIV
jgi:hypothetical protein